jgi:hypothetical protein
MDGRVQRAIATLEMDTEGRAPEGALTSADGIRVEFSGWTEFASTIEDWRARTRDRGEQPGSRRHRRLP